MSNYAPPPPAGYSSDPAQKSRIAAGILGILLGGLGIHRFYLGYVGIGIVQIVVTIVTFGIGSIWGLIEGILILTGSGITKDAKGRPLRD
jgi:TM2 domain-containing membrane protein YozV